MSSIMEGAKWFCSLCNCPLGSFADVHADPPVCRRDAGWTKTLEASKQPAPTMRKPAHLHEVVELIRYAYSLEFAAAYEAKDIERMRIARERRAGVSTKTSMRGVYVYASCDANMCAQSRDLLNRVRTADYDQRSDVHGHCCAP